MAKISVKLKQYRQQLPTIISTNDDVTRILLSMGFDKVFILLSEPLGAQGELQQLDELQESESEVRQRILEAHRTLMDLNEHNRDAFRDLVHSLECE